jgi:hypothetical protein
MGAPHGDNNGTIDNAVVAIRLRSISNRWVIARARCKYNWSDEEDQGQLSANYRIEVAFTDAGQRFESKGGIRLPFRPPHEHQSGKESENEQRSAGVVLLASGRCQPFIDEDRTKPPAERHTKPLPQSQPSTAGIHFIISGLRLFRAATTERHESYATAIL